MSDDGWIDVWPGLRLLVDPATGQARALLSAERQADWVEYNLTVHRKPTALVHDERIYHIHDVEQSPQGWLYTLAPWEGGVRVFRRVELSRAAWEREREAQRDDAARRERWRWGPYLNWVVGFLPSHTQIALSHSHGVNTKAATAINATLSLAAATAMMMPLAAMNSPTMLLLGIGWVVTAAGRLAMSFTGTTACGPTPFEVAARAYFHFTGTRPSHEVFEETE